MVARPGGSPANGSQRRETPLAFPGEELLPAHVQRVGVGIEGVAVSIMDTVEEAITVRVAGEVPVYNLALGFLPCGLSWAAFLGAAGTGNLGTGFLVGFAFGLGTLPVMLAFGAIASMLSSALTHRLLKASGVIVVALGAVMINRGLILTGWGVDLGSITARMQHRETPVAPAAPASAGQTIQMEANALGYQPARFTLIRGVPVKWTINATQITECNKRIVVPSLGLEFDLKPGPQTIEFTPEKTGLVPWSCWMGMIRGQFDVVEAGTPPPKATQTPDREAAQPVSPEPEPQRTTYVVQSGDTLKGIAKKIYGDARRWRDIAAANPRLGKSKLKQGQSLKLPPKTLP
jgi:uncharacterized protein